MKKLLFLILFAVSCLANAQDNTKACLVKGQMYMLAAQNRDANRTPQMALKSINDGFPSSGVDQQIVKNIVNSVYFNPAFFGISGVQLMNIYVKDCTAKPTYYQPV